jgi:competence protein ComEA
VLAWLERRQIIVLALALLALGAGLAANSWLRSDPAGIEFSYGSGVAPGSPIRVQVAGAVTSPGVYELREGDRLVEALAAAGGPLDDADVEALNLARRVRDEERIDVPRRAGAGSAGDGIVVSGRLDINSASLQQLDALPGIGEAYSRRIVDSRRVDGPYKSTRDLVDRKVVPAAVYEQIRDLVTVLP